MDGTFDPGQFFDPDNFDPKYLNPATYGIGVPGHVLQPAQALQIPQLHQTQSSQSSKNIDPAIMAAMGNMLSYIGAAGAPYMIQMTHAIANGTPFSASHFSFGEPAKSSAKKPITAAQRFDNMTNRRNQAQAGRDQRAAGRMKNAVARVQQQPGFDQFIGG